MSETEQLFLEITGEAQSALTVLESTKTGIAGVAEASVKASEASEKAATSAGKVVEQIGAATTQVAAGVSKTVATVAEGTKAFDVILARAQVTAKQNAKDFDDMVDRTEAKFEALKAQGLTMAEIHQRLAEETKRNRQEAAEYQKVLSSLYGDDVAKRTEHVAKAVKEIGGATNLTRKEQEQLSGSIQDTLAKYKAMGQEAPADLKKLGSELRGLTEGFDKARIAVGGVMVAIGAATAGAAVHAVKTAAAYEDAFANVKKTVKDAIDPSQQEPFFKKLRQELKDLSEEIPVPFEQLSKFAALGGQFGIAADQLKPFVVTIANLASSIDGLSAEKAAEQLAQISNVTQDGQQYISNMASALVDLGNTGASSEGNILNLTQRIAQAGKDAGLTTPEIMGLAAAIANLGIPPEQGGTAFVKILTKMQTAVEVGGAKLEEFARIAGMSAESFAKSFEEKPTVAIREFIKGIDKIKDSDEALSTVLKGLEITGEREVRMISTLAGGWDTLDSTIQQSVKVYEANTAAAAEAAERNNTYAAQLITLENAVRNLADMYGQALLPIAMDLIEIAKDLLDVIKPLVEIFADLPKPVQEAALALGLSIGFAGTLVLLAPKITSTITLLKDLRLAFLGLQAAEATGWLATAAKGLGVAGGAAATAAPFLAAAAGAAITARIAITDYEEDIRHLGDTVTGNALIQQTASKAIGKAVTDQTQAWNIARAHFDQAAQSGMKLTKEQLALKVALDQTNPYISEAAAKSGLLRGQAELLSAEFRNAKPAVLETGKAITTTAEKMSVAAQAAKKYAEDLKRVGKGTFDEIVEAHEKYGISIKDLAAKYKVAETSIKAYIAGQKDAEKAAKSSQKEADKAAKAAEKQLEQIAELQRKMMGLDIIEAGTKAFKAFQQLPPGIKLSAEETARLHEQLGKTILAYEQLNGVAPQAMIDTWLATAQATQGIEKQTEAILKLAQIADDSLKQWGEAMKALDKEQRRTAELQGKLTDTYKNDFDAELAQIERRRQAEVEKAKGNQLLIDEANKQADLEIQILMRNDQLKRKVYKEQFAYALNGLGELGAAFAAFADDAEGDLGKVLRALGEMLALTNQAMQTGQQLGGLFGRKQVLDSQGKPVIDESGAFKTTGFGGFKTDTGETTAGSVTAGGIGLGIAAVQGYQQLNQATKGGGAKGILGGAMAGGAIGMNPALMMATGGWSAVVGLVGGAIVGALRKNVAGDIEKRVKANFGSVISEDTSKMIEQVAKDKFKKDRAAAEIYSLKSIIAEAGVDEKNITQLTARLRDTFSMLQTGKFSTADATKTLNENFGALAEYYTKTGKVISKELREIIRLNKEAGTSSEEIKKFLLQQGQAAGAGMAAVVAAVEPKAKDLAAKIKEQRENIAKLQEEGKTAREGGEAPEEEIGVEERLGAATEGTSELSRAEQALNADIAKQTELRAANATEAERVARLTVASFNAAFKSTGDYNAALASNSEAIRQVQQLYADLGMEIEDAALKQLILEQQVVDQHPELMASVEGLNQTAVALTNMNEMTAETFNDLQAQGVEAYTAMQAAGLSQEAAAARMAPTLQTLIALSKDQGFAIDEATQNMIDQATASGALKETAKTDAEVMTEGFQGIGAGIAALVKAMGGEVPEALQKMVDASKKTADKAVTDAQRIAGGYTGPNGVRTAVASTAGAFDDAASAAEDFGAEAEAAARRAQDAVNGVTYGTSPGGLTDVITYADKATQAFKKMGTMATDLPIPDMGEPWIASRTGDTFVVNLQAEVMDADGLEAAVEKRIAPATVAALARNRYGMLTQLQNVLGS